MIVVWWIGLVGGEGMAITFIQSAMLIAMQLLSLGFVIFGVYIMILVAKALKIYIRNNEKK